MGARPRPVRARRGRHGAPAGGQGVRSPGGVLHQHRLVWRRVGLARLQGWPPVQFTWVHAVLARLALGHLTGRRRRRAPSWPSKGAREPTACPGASLHLGPLGRWCSAARARPQTATSARSRSMSSGRPNFSGRSRPEQPQHGQLWHLHTWTTHRINSQRALEMRASHLEGSLMRPIVSTTPLIERCR